MKKILSMILILTIGAALLAGCGGSSQGTGTAGGTATASSVSAADPAADNSTAAEVPEGSYVIYVLDEESGDPIEDAIVQFCSDTECRTGISDAAGKAVFESAPGDYTAHVLKAPEGYDAGSEEFDLTPEVRSIEIKLKKADNTAADEDEATSEGASYTKTSASWDFPKTGFTLTLPADFKDCKGQLMATDYGEIDLGSGVVWASLGYVGRTDEELRSAEEEIESLDFEGDPEGSTQKQADISNEYYSVGVIPFLFVAGLRDGIELDAAMDPYFGDDDITATGELGKAGSYSFYYIAMNPDAAAASYKDANSEEMLAEYRSLTERADEIAAAITVKEPVLPEAPVNIGDVLTFETTDLDGNPVKSEDLFAGHKVTMINIWGTWCTHCIIELPDLEELSHELEEKGCQLVGLCDDALGGDEAILTEAKRILEENGVTYTNIVQTEDLQQTLQLSAFPTTYFVDSEGKVLTLPVVGRDIDQYRARIDEALAIVG